MSKKYKLYTSLFGESKKEKPSTAKTLKKAIKELYAIRREVRKLREEDEVDSSVIEDAIDQVEDVIGSIIDTIGATDPAVATLIDTVWELEASSDFDDFMESEEDSDDVEEITDGIMQKVEEDDEEKKDDEKELDEEEGAPALDMNDIDGDADKDAPPVVRERYKRITK